MTKPEAIIEVKQNEIPPVTIESPVDHISQSSCHHDNEKLIKIQIQSEFRELSSKLWNSIDDIK